MIALKNTEGFAVSIEPDFIESIEEIVGDWPGPCCIVRMSSGKAHEIARSYVYVKGIVRKHYETA